MVTQNTTKNDIQTIGAYRANNIYPTFVGADSKEGTTVIKHLHKMVYEEVHLMYVMRLNNHTFSTDNYSTNKNYEVFNPFNENRKYLSNRYEIRRKGNSFHIQKINRKGKVFQFILHVSVENGSLKYRYVWKKKARDFVDGKKVKMRMFAAEQLQINLMKIYQVAA